MDQQFIPFLLLSTTPWYGWPRVCLWASLLDCSHSLCYYVYRCHEHSCTRPSLLLGKTLRVKWLGYRIGVCLIFSETARPMYHLTLLSVMYESFNCSISSPRLGVVGIFTLKRSSLSDSVSQTGLGNHWTGLVAVP